MVSPDCNHFWTLYAPPKRRWWERRRWYLFCHLCGGLVGSWKNRSEAAGHMARRNRGRIDLSALHRIEEVGERVDQAAQQQPYRRYK